jgi:hypothetical protein
MLAVRLMRRSNPCVIATLLGTSPGNAFRIWLAQCSLRRRDFRGVIKYAKPVAQTDCGYNQPKLRSREGSNCVARYFFIWTSGILTLRLYIDKLNAH